MTATSYDCFFTFFGLEENPFHVSPDPRFYFSTPEHDSALHELAYGLETRQGLLVLTGEAGTGKTTLLNSILDSLEQRRISTSYIFHPLLETSELFEFILRDFGVKFSTSRKGDLVRILHEWLIARDLAGDRPVLVLDEAQALSSATLDELRLLLNLEKPTGKLLQIILAGQTELEEKLRSPELRQLRQRVMSHCKLQTLSEEQTAAYISGRMRQAGLENDQLFPADTIHGVQKISRGIPRVINVLCEHALIAAYGEQQQTIHAEIIERIAADFDLAARPIAIENSSVPYVRRRSFPLIPPIRPSPASRTDRNPTAGPAVEPGRGAAMASVVAAPGRADALATLPESNPAENRTPSETAAAEAVAAPPALQKIFPEGERPFWTERRPSPMVPTFVKRFAVGLFAYGREVVGSFLRDCRAIAAISRSAEAEAIPLAPVGATGSISAPRKARSSASTWLRQPATYGRLPGEPRSSRSASGK